MTQPEIDAIDEELNAQEAPKEPTKEIPNDGITMPEADAKDMPVNKPDMSRSEEEPTTVADKKKELELLKEKNA